MCNTAGFREYLVCLSANYYEILVDTLVYPRRHGGDAILMVSSEITRVVFDKLYHKIYYKKVRLYTKVLPRRLRVNCLDHIQQKIASYCIDI